MQHKVLLSCFCFASFWASGAQTNEFPKVRSTSCCGRIKKNERVARPLAETGQQKKFMRTKDAAAINNIITKIPGTTDVCASLPHRLATMLDYHHFFLSHEPFFATTHVPIFPRTLGIVGSKGYIGFANAQTFVS